MKKFNATQAIHKVESIFSIAITSLKLIGEFIIVLSSTLFATLGVFLSLLFLSYVEVLRVYNGVHLFEKDMLVSSFAAWSVVVYLVIQAMLIVFIEGREGYKKDDFEFSFHTFKIKVKYYFGILDEGEVFVPIKKSPAHYYKSLANFVKAGVVVLSLFGSMNYVFYEVLQYTDENIYLSVISAIFQGNAAVFFPVVAGTLYTLIVVMAVHGMAQYVARETLDASARYEKSAEVVKLHSEGFSAEEVENYDESAVSNKVKAIDAGKKLVHTTDDKTQVVAVKRDGEYLLLVKDATGQITEQKYPNLQLLESKGIRATNEDLRRWRVMPIAS